MPEKTIYDTRFFIEYFYSNNPEHLRRLKEEIRSVGDRMVSALTIHEIHRINLEREGRDVATLRSETIRRLPRGRCGLQCSGEKRGAEGQA
ncbi:hypothetical protein KEJ44_05125 [Candidatus Bathyarchaeota archaeon]|nr:hypothetical protein [Candidatus Bathyarchaeota archaeon]